MTVFPATDRTVVGHVVLNLSRTSRSAQDDRQVRPHASRAKDWAFAMFPRMPWRIGGRRMERAGSSQPHSKKASVALPKSCLKSSLNFMGPRFVGREPEDTLGGGDLHSPLGSGAAATAPVGPQEDPCGSRGRPSAPPGGRLRAVHPSFRMTGRSRSLQLAPMEGRLRAVRPSFQDGRTEPSLQLDSWMSLLFADHPVEEARVVRARHVRRKSLVEEDARAEVPTRDRRGVRVITGVSPAT